LIKACGDATMQHGQNCMHMSVSVCVYKHT